MSRVRSFAAAAATRWWLWPAVAVAAAHKQTVAHSCSEVAAIRHIRQFHREAVAHSDHCLPALEAGHGSGVDCTALPRFWGPLRAPT